MQNKKLPNPLRQFDEWTNVPNMIFDELMRISDPAVFKVLCMFVRKTYGFHKDRDFVAMTQIIEYTGLSKRTITRALKALLESGLLIITKEADGNNKMCREYKLDTEL